MCGKISFIYIPLLLIAVELLELHGPDGQIAWVATSAISSLRSPVASDLARHFPKGVRCIVVMNSGKYIAVTETCPEIRNRLSEPPR